MKVLHLSDTTLSGSPYRASRLISKYSEIQSRHIVFQRKIFDRVFDVDLCGEEMSRDEIMHWLEWADVYHFHNRWKRQNTLKGIELPKKPSVIQIHSPRSSEDFSQEINSGIPLAIIAQYHTREWPEKSFVVPNCVDILDPAYLPISRSINGAPVVSYAPSNANMKGWDDKSYDLVAPILKRMKLEGRIQYQFIFKKPHSEAMALKKLAHIGIEEVSTGSYHMSGLEYLALGVACICHIDKLTEATVKDLTGCYKLPFIEATKSNFRSTLIRLIEDRGYQANAGISSREWMEQYWHPKKLVNHYKSMYERL